MIESTQQELDVNLLEAMEKGQAVAIRYHVEGWRMTMKTLGWTEEQIDKKLDAVFGSIGDATAADDGGEEVAS